MKLARMVTTLTTLTEITVTILTRRMIIQPLAPVFMEVLDLDESRGRGPQAASGRSTGQDAQRVHFVGWRGHGEISCRNGVLHAKRRPQGRVRHHNSQGKGFTYMARRRRALWRWANPRGIRGGGSDCGQLE